jgi:hypothetical protein
MKKIILFLFVLAITFVSCETNEIADKGQLDPNAVITIKPANGVKTRATIADLTALEVVQNAVNIKWQSHWSGNNHYESAKDIARTFMESQKDYQIPALKMLGIDVITSEGEYYKDLTYAFNVVITDVNNDTIGYIPDAVINTARPLIEAAFNDENFTEVYRLFDEAFVFYPIE